MSSIEFFKSPSNPLVNPGQFDFEVVERKFRGHPDSLADMVAERFSQLYIQTTWSKFPELKNKCFPNFSADKVTLCGASTNWTSGKYEVLKPVNALLIGKITQGLGDLSLNVDEVFSTAINEVFNNALGHSNANAHVERQVYSVSMAGTDHDPAFYNPKSPEELMRIISQETVANDTVYVAAYAPLSTTEKLSIEIDNVTNSEEFKLQHPEIGADIKAMVRRRKNSFDITLCLPVFPEKVHSLSKYKEAIEGSSEYLRYKIEQFLRQNGTDKDLGVRLWINTKDTASKKYFAVWGTALSKGDIGAVGRGNRHQGFISGIRPSTNEAVPGKNPNHFAGLIYQNMAESIANNVFTSLNIKNLVYITANNGDKLENPHSVDVITGSITSDEENKIKQIINRTLKNIEQIKLDFIYGDVFKRFMRPLIQ